MLVGYARGKEDFKEVVDMALSKLDVPVTACFPPWGAPPPADWKHSSFPTGRELL